MRLKINNFGIKQFQKYFNMLPILKNKKVSLQTFKFLLKKMQFLLK